MSRKAIGPVLAALTLTFSGAAGSSAPTPIEIVRPTGFGVGPALSGSTVLWGSPDTLYSARGGREHAIWIAPLVGIPPDIPLDSYAPDKRVERDIESVAASPLTTAFVASATLREGYICTESEPRCHTPPAITTPIFSELFVGPPDGPFVRIEGAPSPCRRKQWLARKIDVAGSSVVVSETPRSCRQDAPWTPSRVVLVERSRARVTRTIMARSNNGYFDDVAVTPRYAAWEVVIQSKSVLTVYDRLQRKVAYRARVDRVSSDLVMDLQDSGTLVVASDLGSPSPSPCQILELSSASPSRPRLRPLGVTAIGYRVRTAGGAVTYTRAVVCENPPHPQVVVRRLGGSTTVVAGGDCQTGRSSRTSTSMAGAWRTQRP